MRSRSARRIFTLSLPLLTELFREFAVKVVLHKLYPDSVTTSDQTSIANAAIVGSILGQIIFGSLADRIGRRVTFITTISCVIVGALGSALSFESSAVSLTIQLCFWRFVLGFGVGGEYPLSATVTAESSDASSRGSKVSTVFAMQGWGNLTAALVCYALLSSDISEDAAWRWALAIGGMPGLLTVYWRWKLEESTIFTQTAALDAAAGASDASPLLVSSTARGSASAARTTTTSAAAPKVVNTNSLEAELPHVTHHIHHGPTLRDHLWRVRDTLWDFRFALLGAAGSWLIFDITFYANGLFTSNVIQNFGYDASHAADLALGKVYIALIGLPGYYMGAALIDRMGRRSMQLFGFLAVSVVFAILAGAYDKIESNVGLFITLYGLTFFFANWGPNTTTYVIPSEAFPTRARATCHGMSAASGKLGAVIGNEALGPLASKKTSQSLIEVLAICAGISAFGAVWTLLFTRDLTGVELASIDKSASMGAIALTEVKTPDDADDEEQASPSAGLTLSPI